jgi:L-2-hydroxyglutarate oxidase
VKRIGIIGGGIVSLATALKLSDTLPDVEVVIWEKESEPGQHQSTHNSGVLHAGLHYKPGSFKARLSGEGLRQMVAFCAEHNIPHEICGKLVVAATDRQEPRLRHLFERGVANGLQGLKWVPSSEISSYEPHAGGAAAIHVPGEGIVDYASVIRAMTGVVRARGVTVGVSSEVVSLRRQGGVWEVGMRGGNKERCDYLVNCAGLQSDRIAALAGEARQVRIIPFRGEYFKLRKDRKHLVKNLIYPTPDPKFPFLGVHFTRTIHGEILAGPNAVLAFAREGYRKSDINLRDLGDALGFTGLWKFLGRHVKMASGETLRSLSKRLFCQSLQELVPEVTSADLEPAGSGVRAQAMAPSGDLVDDFCLLERAGALHVLNAPSPAATASLAIGAEIASTIAKSLGQRSPGFPEARVSSP